MESTCEKYFVGIINYPGCNYRSVVNSLDYMGIASHEAYTSNIDDFDALIIPGVGSYRSVFEHIEKNNLRKPLIEYSKGDKPIVGICAGMQIMFDRSEEADGKGLSFFPGKISKLNSIDSCIRVPQMGWSELTATPRSNFEGYSKGVFYFSHSYGTEYTNENFVRAFYFLNKTPVAAIVNSANIYGFQFHPEKSSLQGLTLLSKVIKNEL